MSNNKRIIEIDGIKMEVDMRNAKKVEYYKVGDHIKVLTKDYSDYKSYVGTIVGFDNFEKHPTIVIAYLETSYSEAKIKMLHYYAGKGDVEIAPLNEYDIPLKKSTLLEQFDSKIARAKREVEELENQKEIFESLFGKYFEKKMQVEVEQ